MSWLTAVSIPMVLLVAPGAGAFLGLAADGRFGTQPFGFLAGIGLGLATAAVRIRSVLRNLDTGADKPKGSHKQGE